MANWESRTLAESGIVKKIGEEAAAAADSVTGLAVQIQKVAEGAKLVLGGYADIIGMAIKAAAQPLLDQLNDYRNIGFYCLVVNPFELNKPIEEPFGLQMKTDKNGGVIFKPSIDLSFDPRSPTAGLSHGQEYRVGEKYSMSLNISDLPSNYKDRNGRNKSHENFIPPVPEVVGPPYKLVRGGYDPATWTGTMPDISNPGLPELKASECLKIMSESFDDEGDVPKFQMKNQMWPPMTDDPAVLDGPYTEEGTAVDSFDPTANLAFHLYSSANTDLALSDRGRLTKQIQAGRPNYAGTPGVTVSALVILCAATDPEEFYDTLTSLANFFGGGAGVVALTSIMAAAQAFQKIFEPDNVKMTLENNTEYGTFGKDDFIMGESSGAVGQIVKISEGEKSIRTRTVSEIKTDPETNDIISIWNRDVDMNPDGHWKTYDIEYTPKFDVTNRFEPNERIYEAEEYERTAVGSARPSKYYRIKGEENTGLPIHLSRQALPKYGKVMGLSALAPNSVVPDFTSFTAGQMIPGWNDFFDGLIELANGLIGLATDALEFLNRLIQAIDDLTAYLVGILAKIKTFLAYLEKGLPNAGIWMLDIKTNGGNKEIQDALTGSSGAPGANYKFTFGIMLMSLEINGVDPMEKLFELLGMGAFQEVT